MLRFDGVLLLEGLELVFHFRKVIGLPDSALALLVRLRRYPLLLQMVAIVLEIFFFLVLLENR